MTSQDGLALLKQMHQRGEITDEQYDTLRRHVLWGTPPPTSADAVPAPRSGSDPPGGYVPGTATVGPDRFPGPPGYPEPRGRLPGEPAGGYPPQPPGPAPRRYASRRERREAERAQAEAAHLPPAASTGPLPPVREAPPRRHRRDGTDDPPLDRPLPDGLPPESERPWPDGPPPVRRHRHAPPDEEAPRRGRRPAEPTRRQVPPEEVTARRQAPPEEEAAPRRGRRPAEPTRRQVPSEEVTTRRQVPPEEVPTRRQAPSEEVTTRRQVPPEEVTPRRAGAEPDRRRRPVEPGPEPDRRKRQRGAPAAGKQKRHPRRRSVVAVLTSVVLALALAAGGVYWFELRRQGLAPPAYARQACGTVRDWQQGVDSSNARLVNQISRQQNKTTIRSDVTAYYTTIAGSTDQLRVAILDLGPADLTGGREYADSLAAAVGDQASALRRLAGQAGKLDPAAATFQTDLQGILTGADAAVSAVTAALARPAAGITTELRTTLSNEPACAPYVG